MKIAVLVSGQFRTGEHCLQNQVDFMRGHDVDWFCHTWDYDTPKTLNNLVPDQTDEHKLDVYHVEECIKDIMNPKMLGISTSDHLRNVQGDTPYTWDSLLLSMRTSYAMMMSYGESLEQEYDLVVKSRYDLVFNRDTQFTPGIGPSPHKEIRARDIGWMEHEHGLRCMNDVWFYGTRPAMGVALTAFDYIRDSLNRMDPTMASMDGRGPGVWLWKYLHDRNCLVSHDHHNEVIFRPEAVSLHPNTDWEQIQKIFLSYYD